LQIETLSYLKPIVIIIALTITFGLEGNFPLFKDRHNRIRHAFPNIAIAVLNGLILHFFFIALIVRETNWIRENSFGFVHMFDMPVYLKAIAVFILFDLWMYLWHLVNHKIHFLWRFHRVHHSDIEMDATTSMRFHPGEIIYSSCLRLAIIPLIGINITQLLIYEMFLQAVIIFHHSNINLPEKLDRIIRMIIVTPNMHRIHHSTERSETNSNYSSVFSLWDRLNRTYRRKDNTITIKYGLRILREAKWQKLWGMLVTPFKR
jgi:sterol desaturase/sphingolipid hydroxylase (fatty acid hydroxylase superfamily)